MYEGGRKEVCVNGQTITIRYLDSDNKNAIARIGEGEITIKLPRKWPHGARREAAESLEKRIMRRFQRRVEKIRAFPENLTDEQFRGISKNAVRGIGSIMAELNKLHFNSQLGQIRLRRNTSNWGSCSRQNNITINFALLFMPKELLEYVLVHELVHTKIRNHSKGFWQVVAKVIPDYKARKKELRKYLLAN